MLVRRSVKDLLPGDHAWFPFSSGAEQDDVIGAWLRDGLAIRDKIIYVTDAEPGQLPGMRGEDLRPAVKAGLLTLIPVREACFTNGDFDPVKLLGTLSREIARAEQQEFRGIRVTAEMPWGFDEPCGDAGVDRCERDFGRKISPSVSVTAICQTDVRNCVPSRLDLLADHHEVRVLPDPCFDDPVLSITRTYRPPGLRLRGQLDPARHTHFAEALQQVTCSAKTVHLDLTELDFLSIGALRTMAELTRRYGPDSTMVLQQATPGVRSFLNTVGLHRFPGIRLDDG